MVLNGIRGEFKSKEMQSSGWLEEANLNTEWAWIKSICVELSREINSPQMLNLQPPPACLFECPTRH